MLYMCKKKTAEAAALSGFSIGGDLPIPTNEKGITAPRSYAQTAGPPD
jgi:hypothetical protein